VGGHNGNGGHMNTTNYFWTENGKPKAEVKIGMVMDNYKLKNKDDWWNRGVGQLPEEFTRIYKFDREEISAGITQDTITICRWYKLTADD
jgi:hypothetical protein